MRLLARTLPCLALALAAPGLARAGAPVDLGVRVGGAVPFGALEAARPVRDTVTFGLPAEVEARWRFTPRVAAGLYGRAAPLWVAGAFADTCGGCSFVDYGAGLTGEARLGEAAARGPFAGLALGWAFLRGTGGGVAQTTSGPEAGLSAGWDFAAGESGLALAPFVGLRLARFTRETQAGGGPGVTRSIAEPAVHGWAGAGVRVRFAL